MTLLGELLQGAQTPMGQSFWEVVNEHQPSGRLSVVCRSSFPGWPFTKKGCSQFFLRRQQESQRSNA